LKRAGFILIIAVLILFGAGCVSSGKAALLSQKDPIALVSVISNEDINWKGEAPTNPDILGPLVKRKLRNEPDMAAITKANDLINTAEFMLRSSVAASGCFTLAERETVLNSRAYQNAKERRFPNRDMVTPDKFRFIDVRDKNFPAALSEETGIQRSMHVEFNFTKMLYTGISFIGSCRPDVEMTVVIMDAKRKTIYRKTVTSLSTSGTKVVNGVYNQAELLELFQEAIDGVLFDFFDGFK